MILACVIIALMVAQRLSEIVISNRNTRVLLARGAKEYGAGHYPVIIALHTAWLVSLVVFLPSPFAMQWGWLAVFVLLEIARVWVMLSLGPHFTTRIISRDGDPLVRGGPYRLLRHPNYAVVVGEIAVLPLAFGEVWVAAAFSALNAAMLAWRIRTEDRALASRR